MAVLTGFIAPDGQAISFQSHKEFSPFRAGTRVPRPALSRQDRGAQAPGRREEKTMLSWVVTFLIIALIAGVLGFGGIAGASVEIAKVIFFIAVLLFLISAVVGLVRGRSNV
jgi:uncharacterized membrane protein YtjA (UPF0391 family)